MKIGIWIGFKWQRFGLWEVRAAYCWTQLVPANSKVDPPEAAAELINEGGGAFVKMHLRKCRKHQTEEKEMPMLEEVLRGGQGNPTYLEGLQAVDKLSPEQVFPQRDCSL